MQERGLNADAAHAANDPNVPRNLVVCEDGGKLLRDFGAATHLAAVKAHHDRVVSEAVRVGLGVLSIPSFEDRPVQPLYAFRVGRSCHGAAA